MTKEMKFQGNVKVYLEGRDALEITNSVSDYPIIYYVGSPESEIQVRDFRKLPIQAAKRALSGQDIYEFADVFNEQSWIEVYSNGSKAEIEMYESNFDADKHTLWLGVLHENEMSVHQIEWEILKRLDKTKTAFAAIVS